MRNFLSVKILSFLRINLLILPIIAASLIWDYFVPLSISYVCAFLHELAHIAAARMSGIKISYIELQPFGVCARLKSEVIEKPASEILIALAGPTFSLLLAAVGHISGKASEYFIYCNLATAVVNLLPVLPLDGGRVLRAALTLKMGAVAAYNTAVKASRIPLAVIVLISVYAIVTAQFNFSLILIGVFLLGNLFAEQHNISRQAVREMLHYKEKLKPAELSRATILCADKSTPARKILPLLSYNRYHIIHITDRDMKVIKTVTEGQLLEAIASCGIRVTLEEV